MDFLKVDKENIDECIELFVKTFNDEPWNESWTTDTAKNRLLDYLNTPHSINYLLKENSKIIAACFGKVKQWFSGYDYYLEEMYVDPTFQRKSYGSILLNKLEKELRKYEVSSITLLTGKENSAFAFYKKNNFKGIDSLVFCKKDI